MTIADNNGLDSLKENFENIVKNPFENFEIEILEYSPALKEDNKNIYDEVNKSLLEIINDHENGEYLHITGEMRAFSDPIHREKIKILYEKRNYQIKTVFYLPSTLQISGHDILTYNKEHWDETNWIDYLDAFDILGEGQALLYRVPEREELQYSLFGDELILFQSKHSSKVHIKEVWILKSRKLFKFLFNRAKNVINRSRFIHPMIFNDFKLSISNDATLHIMFLLLDNGKLDIERFNNEIKKINRFNEFNLENLKILEFIQQTDEYIELTNYGKNYISIFR